MSDEIKTEKPVITKKVESNNGEFADSKIVKTEQVIKENGDKKKIMKKVTYKNGVVKSTLIGMMKGKRIILDRGIDHHALKKG